MSVRHRVKKLERQVKAQAPPPQDEDILEEDWLPLFEKAMQDGLFAREPDFPRALEELRQKLAAAAAQDDPPFLPPAHYRKDLPEKRRVAEWRRARRYPGVDAALFWMMEFYERVAGCIPPVSEVEFAELGEWSEAHAEELYQKSLPSQLLALNVGTTSLANVRYGLSQGPRVRGAGKLADQVRELKARYGDGIPGVASSPLCQWQESLRTRTR